MRKFQLRAVSMVLSFVFLFFLSGCGGGGSSSTPPANAASGVTAAQVAGVYKFSQTASFINAGTSLCNGLITGSITLTATAATSGTYSGTQNAGQALCLSGTTPAAAVIPTVGVSGTFTVASDGSGTMTNGSTGTVYYFQLSKDLNTVGYTAQSSLEIDNGVAARM